jgi:hypothetical protein
MFDVRPRFSLLAACALALSLSGIMLGCGGSRQQSSSDQQTAVLYNKDKVVCKRDNPTGSHIPRTRCYRRQEAQNRRENDQSQIEAIKLGGAINAPGGQ